MNTWGARRSFIPHRYACYFFWWYVLHHVHLLLASLLEVNGNQVDYNISILRSLAVDPNNPQVIYAGDAQDGVFVSTNAGMNWSQQSTGLTLPITIFALVFDDPGKKLYAATDKGVFVSADAARHWIDLSGLPSDSYTSLAFDLNASACNLCSI